MPDDFFNRPDLVGGLNWGPSKVDLGPLMQLAQADQKPATKQKASTSPQGGVDPTVAQNLGAGIGKWIQQYRDQMQRYGVGQPQGVAGQPGPIATPPIVPQQLQPQRPMPQQQAGPPMNIVPQGYGYQ